LDENKSNVSNISGNNHKQRQEEKFPPLLCVSKDESVDNSAIFINKRVLKKD
jgi:hypothetical protein